MMPSLSNFSNVSNTALIILKDLGYDVWWRDEEKTFICCQKDGWDFMAQDPVELLGLIKIYEFHKPDKHTEYWWKIQEPWLLDSIPTTSPEYKPVWSKER
jgi:hypothetical protein